MDFGIWCFSFNLSYGVVYWLTLIDSITPGGIGEAVMSAVAMERNIIVRHLAVPRVPRSGKCDELLDMFGISASAIVKAAKEISNL